MKKWLCMVCGFIYDEAEGWPDDGIEPGTPWSEVPEDWLCPDCGVGKADFDMVCISDPVNEATEAVAAQQASAPMPPAASPIVIIGSGHAGYSLAEALRQKDPNCSIVVFTQDDGRHYSKPALSNGFARQHSPDDLVRETALAREARLGIRIHALCPVDSIDTRAKVVHTPLGEQPYSKLVLAQGAEPARLPLPGSGAAEVVSVNDLADYRTFRRRLTGRKRVAIIGNGLIGCEFANDLADAGYSVSVVGLTRWPMDPLLPQQAGRRLQQALAGLGVDWHLETSVTAVEHSADGYALSLANGREIEADVVLSAVGLTPRTALAANAGLRINRGILVDEQMRTSNASVYALGDCAEIGGQLLPFLAPINHAVEALADTVLGKPVPVRFPPMPVIVKTPAHAVTFVLPAPGSKGDWQVSELAEGVRALFYDRKGRLAGFVLTGACTEQRQQWLDRCASGLAPVRSVA